MGLEGNAIVRFLGAKARGGGGRSVGGRGGRSVGGRGRWCRALFGRLRAEHGDGVSNDVGDGKLVASGIGLDLVREMTFDINLLTLFEVFSSNLGKTIVAKDGVPGGVGLFGAVGGFERAGGGNGESCHGGVVGEGLGERILAQVADKNNFVNRCHDKTPGESLGERSVLRWSNYTVMEEF